MQNVQFRLEDKNQPTLTLSNYKTHCKEETTKLFFCTSTVLPIHIIPSNGKVPPLSSPDLKGPNLNQDNNNNIAIPQRLSKYVYFSVQFNPYQLSFLTQVMT